MRLIEFHVENYKSIREPARLAPLSRLNCIIGPNNEGKSSFLECLRLIHYLTDEFQGDETESRQYFIEMLPDKSIDNPQKLQLVFEFTGSDVDPIESADDDNRCGTVTYTVAWGSQIGLRAQSYYITNVTVNPDGGTPPIETFAPQGNGNYSIRISGLSPLLTEGAAGPTNSVNLQNIRTDITNSLNNNVLDLNGTSGLTRYLPQWASRIILVPAYRSVAHTATMHQNPIISSESLPVYLLEMQTNRVERFKRFEALLGQLIPSVKYVYTHVEGQNVSIRVSPIPVEDSALAYRLDNVGDGVQEILLLAAMIWLSDDNSIILIEEPERGLHASSQRLLLGAAMSHARDHNKQLFWTTHSTLMAPLVKCSSVFLTTLTADNGTAVATIEQPEANDILQAMGHRRGDFYDADLLVLFDGETEDSALPYIFEYILGSLTNRGIHYSYLGGDLPSKHESVRWFLGKLPPGSTKIFLCVDNDGDTPTKVEDLVREFEEQGRFSQDHVHIWNCEVDPVLGAEFENNFSASELIAAANDLAGDFKLTEQGLLDRNAANPAKKISKILASYYHEEYEDSLSKPKMGTVLGEMAIKRIEERPPDDDHCYEFEGVAEQIRTLLQRD